MDFFSFDNVSFTYPPVDGELDTDGNGNPIIPAPVFDYFTAALPPCFMSLVGPNGSGKSTLMLLAAGRVLPNQGHVRLFGEETGTLAETARDALASFVYQNMEFETDDHVGALLEQVFGRGFHTNASPYEAVFAEASAGAVAGKVAVPPGFFDEVVSAFELTPVLGHTLTGISKGEIQRVLLAFSVLYGSHSVFMDEPLFAMEERQKHQSLEFLRAYAVTYHKPVCISMHELELSRKYADNVLLFKPGRNMDFGTPDEVLVKEALEEAYGVPAAMLRETEELNRRNLKEAAQALEARR